MARTVFTETTAPLQCAANRWEQSAARDVDACVGRCAVRWFAGLAMLAMMLVTRSALAMDRDCDRALRLAVTPSYIATLAAREELVARVRSCVSDDAFGQVHVALALGTIPAHDAEARRLLEPYAKRDRLSGSALRTLAWVEESAGHPARARAYRDQCQTLPDNRGAPFCERKRSEFIAAERVPRALGSEPGLAAWVSRALAAAVAISLLARRFRRRVDPIGALRAALPDARARAASFAISVAVWTIAPWLGFGALAAVTLGAASLTAAIAVGHWERRTVLHCLTTDGLSGYEARPIYGADPALPFVASGTKLVEPLVIERVNPLSYREMARTPVCILT